MKARRYITFLFAALLAVSTIDAQKKSIGKPSKPKTDSGSSTVVKSGGGSSKGGGSGKGGSSSGSRYAPSYIEIVGMEMGNTDFDYNIINSFGSTLYADEVLYLSPCITVVPHTSSTRDIELYVKITDPYGYVVEGDASPRYSYKTSVTVDPWSEEITLSGFGGDQSTYDPGRYTIEIFDIKGKKLYGRTVDLLASRPKAFEVLSCEPGNSDTDEKALSNYGATLYAEDMRFLRARLKVKASQRKDVDIYVKIIKPDGTTCTSPSSPTNYTYKVTRTVSPNDSYIYLPGWGNNTVSTYTPGNYSIEIYDSSNRKLYTHSFYMTSHKAPFTVTGCDISNQDDDCNILSAYGTALYAQNLRFITPRLKIKPNVTSATDVTIYVKFFQNGKLDRSSSSPEGYTYSYKATVRPGDSYIVLPGWGNNTKSIFDPGAYSFEFYDAAGQKLYTKSFSVQGASAKITKHTVEHNVRNSSGEECFVCHLDLNAREMKEKKIKYSIYFHQGSKALEYYLEDTVLYDDSDFTNWELWVPNKALNEKFDHYSGAVVYYDIYLRDSTGRQLDSVTGESFSFK